MQFKPAKGASILSIDYALWWKKTGQLLNQLIPYAEVTAREIALKALRQVKEFTPKTKTGTDLKGLWVLEENKLQTREDFIIKSLYKDQKIIVFFEEGTKPHEIHAKNSPWLVFKTSHGYRRAKMVNHPGTTAYKMIAKTEKLLDPIVNGYVTMTLKMAQNITAGKGRG